MPKVEFVTQGLMPQLNTDISFFSSLLILIIFKVMIFVVLFSQNRSGLIVVMGLRTSRGRESNVQ